MTIFRKVVSVAAMMGFAIGTAHATSFLVQPFATGGAIGGTSPDSVSFGDGSVWIAYQNGADSAGASGSSTVVRYAPTGGILHTWSITGNVDGLKVDPVSGLVWALQNNDGNSVLSVINPTTNAVTSYSYGASYTNVPNRGFDDVVFRNGQVFLSETNPIGPTDPVIVQLTSGLISPLQIAPILTSTFAGPNLATGLSGSTTVTDSDSLKLTPSGDLALTGEADQEIAFVHLPGTVNQSESFVALLGPSGPIAGLPDDTIFPTATQGVFYFADTGANTVYSVIATGLTLGSVYIDVGNEFGSLDTTTGIVTPIFTGTSPHGADFATFAQAGIPEPGSAYLMLGGLLLWGAKVYRRRLSSGSRR